MMPLTQTRDPYPPRSLPVSRTASVEIQPEVRSNPLTLPGFVLFLITNVILFLRPNEWVPGLDQLPIYNIAIVFCALLSVPFVFAQLTPTQLITRPITACVLGMIVAVAASHIMTGSPQSDLRESLEKFLKIQIYYLLLVGLVDSPVRLRLFLGFVVWLILGVTLIGLLQYHEFIHLPSLTMFQDFDEDEFGELTYLPRLLSTGFYNDPNDLALIISVGVMLCLYFLARSWFGLGTLWWLPILGVFGFALYETKSRGGFISLLAGLLVLFWTRFGRKKSLLLALIVVPTLFAVFAGRMTEITMTQGTGLGRIQLWNEGFVEFKASPLFGIGEAHYGEVVGHVAHNSFLQCFVELGAFGGVLYLGAFYVAFMGVRRLAPPAVQITDPEMARFRPYLLAVMGTYIAGMMSLSRGDIPSTYMILGTVTIFLAVTKSRPPLVPYRFNPKLLAQLAGVGFAFIVFIYIIIKALARYE